MLSYDAVLTLVSEELSRLLVTDIHPHCVHVDVNNDTLFVKVSIPCKRIAGDLQHTLANHPDLVNDYQAIQVEQGIPANVQQHDGGSVAGIKNIVAIASAKGGVGKSTTAANIALALAHEGAQVGVLDADIYGPSQPQMLAAAGQKPVVVGGKTVKPISTYGLQLMSMGNLVDATTAMVWRGPMATGALQQLLRNTEWGALDYLIIDMPPGTGDIQLTLAQTVSVSAAVIVTTPQEIALLDAKKGIEMFRKVNIPIAGIVENMSMHICTACGHQEAIFGEKGGHALAQQYHTRLLGQLPLQKDIRENADSGKPSVIADPESPASVHYRHIALQLAQYLAEQSANAAGPEILIEDN